METLDIKYFADLITSGQVVAFPTETVYGLGASAFNEAAVKKIFALKQRPADNPLIVHVASLEEVTIVAEKPSPIEEKLFSVFSPGPLTVLLKKKKNIPDIVTAGSPLVGVRIPSHPIALQLLSEARVPIAAPSANISGKPSATHHEHVIAVFGDTVPVIRAGATTYGMESTVVIVKNEQQIVILRQGVITKEDIQRVFPDVNVSIAGEDDSDLQASPGTRYKHYAPQGQVTLLPLGNAMETAVLVKDFISKSRAEKIVVLCSAEVVRLLPESISAIALGSENDLSLVAHNLYDALLQCDKLGATEILIQTFPETGIGRTVMERLRRAAES